MSVDLVSDWGQIVFFLCANSFFNSPKKLIDALSAHRVLVLIICLCLYRLAKRLWLELVMWHLEEVMDNFWMRSEGLSWKRTELVFLSLLWFVTSPPTNAQQDQSQQCEIIPSSMSLPVLEKKGDIILGGLFSLHDMVVEPSLSFTSTPPPTQCTR